MTESKTPNEKTAPTDDASSFDIKSSISDTAFAFRGYNVTNLGRSAELLAHPVYAGIVEDHLAEASQICSDVVGRPIDLVTRVRTQEETTLETYDEAISLITAMELAQLRILDVCFDIQYASAKMGYGYSLGEIPALAGAGAMSMADCLVVPLSLAADCVSLAHDITMGVLFSRDEELDLDLVEQTCAQINFHGDGAIGVSTILSPNSLLLLGQQDTVHQFRKMLRGTFPPKVHLRLNTQRWPPLHTPILWQRNISNRAGVMLQTLGSEDNELHVPVYSMVTGKADYEGFNWRKRMTDWIDHPQRVWDIVYETLAQNVDVVLHIGPEPNLLPATFKRLSANVDAQSAKNTISTLGIRAVKKLAERFWLERLLPSRAALLRAPKIRHIILEDWLLAQNAR